MADMISVVDIHFIIMVFLGSLAGLFVGAIPGLSVSMATALLVSITYTWDTVDALAMIMGVYVRPLDHRTPSDLHGLCAGEQYSGDKDGY